jgi:hypothetical protein
MLEAFVIQQAAGSQIKSDTTYISYVMYSEHDSSRNIHYISLHPGG